MMRRRTTLTCFTLVAAASIGTAGTAAADDPPPAVAPPAAPPPAAPPPAAAPPAAAPPAAAPPAAAPPAAAPPAAAPPAAPPTDAPAQPPAGDASAPASDTGAPAAPTPSGPVGTVKGRILDGGTQEGLPGASVRVLDGSQGGSSLATEIDGTYTLTLAPGTYTIVISTPEYVEQRRTVTVGESQIVALDLTLAPVPKTGATETIEVYSAIDTRKDSAVLAERRGAATVSDAISAQQIARSPDSNAADAAKRMVAATIQDNRYIVIRGLGGRYSTTLLNGVPLPSPDPDVPAAPLDLFPAALVTNLTVQKTFAPDMPGNFAGGALGIETRSYPTKFLFKAKIGMAGNTQSSFRTLNGQDGGSRDVLGYDNGSRSLPGAIPRDKLVNDGDPTTAESVKFKNNWSIDRGRVGPNLNGGATIGDTLKVSDQRLGYFGSVSFSHGYVSRRDHIARVGGSDGNGGKVPSDLQLDDQKGIEQANLGALVGAGLTPASGHKIDLFTLYAHTADITSSEVTGTENNGSKDERTRLQFLQRELGFAQLVGDDRLADKVILEWQANVARVAQHEPDTRDLLRNQNDGQLTIIAGPGGTERLFSELTDNTWGGAAAVRMPFEAVKLKAGASIQHSGRDYQTRRFLFDFKVPPMDPTAPPRVSPTTLSPDQAFAPENADLLTIEERTKREDGYTATRTVAGVYVMADVNPTPQLRLVGGARFEQSNLDLGLEAKLDPTARPMEHTIRDDNDILPSLNAVYAITPSTNLRAAYAMTLARANFRELAPAVYFDYVRRRTIGGNPDLVETKINNADLRWETFLGDSELVAASVFAKHFTQPIYTIVSAAGDGDNISFFNQKSANIYGVELEARLSLGRLTPALAAFSVGGNLSLIGSNVKFYGGDGGTSRALQGQSPYVANVALGYENQAHGTRVDLAYNSFGRRIEETGISGAGDIYEEPVHRLDLTVSQPLPRNLRLKLAAANLLDQRVVRTQDGVEILAYNNVGVTVLGSVEYSLE